MISAAIGLALFIVATSAYFMLEQSRTLADLREANKRLHHENQTLTEALLRRHDVHVDLRMTETQKNRPIVGPVRQSPPPYFGKSNGAQYEPPDEKVAKQG